MKTRRLATIDLDTGEQLDGTVLGWMPRPKIKEDFFMGFTEGFRALAKDKRIQGKPLTVLMALFARLDFENYLHVSQQDLAKELGMRQPNVSRALNTLLEAGVLKRGPKSGRIYTYQLNSGYAWKGSAKNLDEARRKHLQLVRP